MNIDERGYTAGQRTGDSAERQVTRPRNLFSICDTVLREQLCLSKAENDWKVTQPRLFVIQVKAMNC